MNSKLRNDSNRAKTRYTKRKMQHYSFYEIKSQKSQELVNGLKKISLVCADHPEFHMFLWMDEKDELKHLQFLFDENLIEWFEDRKELIASETNRKTAGYPMHSGTRKGVRTIHAVKNHSIVEKGQRIVNAATFPETYESMIRHRLN